jgi:hypothetical protein
MMSPAVVLTKQGVRNLNELGPKKKPDAAKQAKDAEGSPATEAPETAAPEKKVESVTA